MKLLREWCIECDYYQECYPENGLGPLYCEPACLIGPSKTRRDQLIAWARAELSDDAGDVNDPDYTPF